MFKEVLPKTIAGTGKSSGVLTNETNVIAAGKVIFDFHSVSKDYSPATIQADEENFGSKRFRLKCAELLFKNKLALCV
jgi:hypothetical protein